MQNVNNETITGLNHLLQMVNDALNAYMVAADTESNAAVKDSFQNCIQERKNYIKELKELIVVNGGNIGDAFAPVITEKRIWRELGASADENKEITINACINGEKAAIKAYEKIAADKQTSEQVRIVLLKHMNGFELAIRRVTSHLTPANDLTEVVK